MPRIQRFAHSIQRLTYLNFFRPEERDVRPSDVLVPETEPSPTSSAWSAMAYSGFVPYRDRPER